MSTTASDSGSTIHEDWRVRLFGSYILQNSKTDDQANGVDVEAQTTLIPTEVAFDADTYDYIAVFIGADYCPHCKNFAPSVQASADNLEQKKRTKVVFVSNDRTEEAFDASCKKNAGLYVMPYDLDKTAVMRDLFKLTTIPAFMILRNNDFANKEPTILSDGRYALVADPEVKQFPWAPVKASAVGDADSTDKKPHMSTKERLFKGGQYGKWWELGHHANPAKPDQMYMDEHAVRIRAGLLNIITWIALINIFFWRDPVFVKVLFPLVAVEFLVSANIGLSPLAPIGTLATLIACVLHEEPFWKPAKPKRFAWYIGLTLATMCLIFFTQRKALGDAYRPLIGMVVVTCNLATWLESSAGFCIGCFIYNNVVVPWFQLEECSECKL